MFTNEIINSNIPRLKPRDTVAKALQLLNDFRVTHLPVVSEGKYLGIISEEDLLDLDESDHDAHIEALEQSFIAQSVPDDLHFLSAVNYVLQHDSTIVPVTKRNGDYIGVITLTDLLRQLGAFSGVNEMGGIIVLQMERPQFAISEISRIVESNDCTILHLNTTTDPATGLLTVTLQLNSREVATVVATFERYDYDVVYYHGSEKFDNEINSNYDNLMKYLDI